MFYQTFFSPEVKRYLINTYNHGIYQLPQLLSNVLGLRTLGYWEKIGKYLNFIER